MRLSLSRSKSDPTVRDAYKVLSRRLLTRPSASLSVARPSVRRQGSNSWARAGLVNEVYAGSRRYPPRAPASGPGVVAKLASSTTGEGARKASEDGIVTTSAAKINRAPNITSRGIYALH